MSHERLKNLVCFYSLLDRQVIGGARILGDCRGRMHWPAAEDG